MRNRASGKGISRRRRRRTSTLFASFFLLSIMYRIITLHSSTHTTLSLRLHYSYLHSQSTFQDLSHSLHSNPPPSSYLSALSLSRIPFRSPPFIFSLSLCPLSRIHDFSSSTIVNCSYLTEPLFVHSFEVTNQ